MFVNFSNHSSDRWDDKQLKAAQMYGEVVDIQFPNIPALANENEIEEKSVHYADLIIKQLTGNDAVMVQGEFTLTYSVVNILKNHGVKVVSACSDRNVVEEISEDGKTVRKAVFDFKRFREYR